MRSVNEFLRYIRPLFWPSEETPYYTACLQAKHCPLPRREGFCNWELRRQERERLWNANASLYISLPSMHDHDGKCLMLWSSKDKRLSFSLACESSLVRFLLNLLAHRYSKMRSFTFLRCTAAPTPKFSPKATIALLCHLTSGLPMRTCAVAEWSMEGSNSM